MGMIVASVPAGHVYVRHLADPDEAGSPSATRSVVRLADPRPRADVPEAQWWPPRMLEPGWVDEHADEFDLMHIHFGFDAVAPEQLAEVARTLRAHGKPLVLTVHDLRNPHHPDPGLHAEQLGVLVEAADAVITLTTGAAREIERRWGRHAQVIAHPHVVEEPRRSAPRAPHEGFRIGVHAKSLRAGMDPLPVIETILQTLPRLPGASLRVDAHRDIMDPENPRHGREFATRVRAAADAGLLELVVHDYFTDAELWDYLQSLDATVLPYRFGTHSGWLEACHDLGTAVLAPDCGHYADQRPCVSYAVPGPEGAAPPLAQALHTAYVQGPPRRPTAGERRAERTAVAVAHERLYAALLARRSTCTS